VRFQSSSSGTKLSQREKDEKIQQELLKNKQLQQHKENTLSHSNKIVSSGKHLKNTKNNINDIKIIKKGFSNVAKVPSTINLEPRDVLLDKLYQGYNPLLSPIKPKTKKPMPKILVNIYEDLAFDDDGFGDEDAIDSLIGPKLQISKYIFDKNPQVEAKLKDLDADISDSDDKSMQTGNIKNETLFVKRDTQHSKRGRFRLQYKKNLKKSKN
jgi:hypothetical protein